MYELLQILIAIATALLALKKNKDLRPLVIAAYSCVALSLLKMTSPGLSVLSYFLGMAILIYFAVRLVIITIDNNINDSKAIALSKIGCVLSVYCLSIPFLRGLEITIVGSSDVSWRESIAASHFGLVVFFISFFYLAFVEDE